MMVVSNKMRAMRRILRVCCVLAAPSPFWAGLPAAAQDILPGAFSGWTPTGSKKFSAASLEQAVGDKAGVLREYGVARAERRSYQKSNAGPLEVTVYQMRDSTAAYGA